MKAKRGNTWGASRTKTKLFTRHRNHPVTNNRYTASVSGSDGFTSEQIEDSLRIR